MHPAHLQLFTVSLPFRKLFPLLSFSSTEGRAAFRGISRDPPWLRKSDEISTCSLSLFSQDCYFSHFKLSFSYQKHQITFCIPSTKPGCEIYCYFLLLFQQRMEKPTEVRKKRGIAGGTWGTRQPWLKRHWPMYTSRLWRETRMINSSKKGPPIVHMALVCHQQQRATQS